VATLADIAHAHTPLSDDAIEHLVRLTGSWGLLADFSFSDLLLATPPAASGNGHAVVLAQVRPVTSQTLYFADWVGAVLDTADRPHLAEAVATRTVVEADVRIDGLAERARTTAIPVSFQNDVIAVLTREWAPGVGRQAGELERTYLDIFARFARMIVGGQFPYREERRSTEFTPRVGDGVIAVDAGARVDYSSPNAVSALHRCGINTNAVGLRLAELGFDDSAVRQSFEAGVPVIAEHEQPAGITMAVRCLPILSDRGKVTGGIVLVRDVSEVRRRDRMLLSKDATIREIHHRVKNNLQTISSLLRLQGRRLASLEAKQAIDESVRRIRAIALVHETLSHEAGDDVPFIDIVRPLCRMAEEGLQSPDHPVRITVRGDGGDLPAAVATPLAVVLTELLQNAVDHGFPAGTGSPTGSVVVLLGSDGRQLSVRVVDSGVGLPDDFARAPASSLGLSIVRTLVTTELAGSMVMRSVTTNDLAAAGIEPAALRGEGTVVELSIPVGKLLADRG
jgi:two-component system, sensor histidine kinase PdtaS